ncbi:MAG: hypothetical protein ACKO4T_11060 [Planctomycetaceae bacterium]
MRSLLMGGQACVLYGGAEFSRDTDVVVLSDDDNLDRLGAAVEELRADVIAVPPFAKRHLEAGHAVHFRCHAAAVEGMRLDVMAKIRGLPDFEPLWERRSTIETDEGLIEVLSLPDLVTAKKTQRDKDWPMIARLVEADYAAFGPQADLARRAFWLRELRTPSLLIEVVGAGVEAARAASAERPLLTHALAGDATALAAALRAEEDQEREADRTYWAPLRLELEELRRTRRG